MFNYEIIGIVIALVGIFLTVIGQALYVAYKLGTFEEKLNTLEKKQDMHNNLIERTTKVEAKADSAHKRLDDGKEEFRDLAEKIDEIKDFIMEHKI